MLIKSQLRSYANGGKIVAANAKAENKPTIAQQKVFAHFWAFYLYLSVDTETSKELQNF